MDWEQNIRRWRALPEVEKIRLRWETIPADVAQSMAFEGEPVDQAMLEAVHACRPMPRAMSRQDSER